MQLFFMWLLFIIAILSGVFYYAATADFITAFLHPLSMLLIIANAIILPRLQSLKPYFKRYKNGIFTIFITLLLIVLVVHVAVIAYESGYNFDLLIIVPLCVGTTLIVTGNTLQRFKLPDISATNRIWNQCIRPFSRILVICGAVMLLTIFFPEMMTIFFIILGTMIISLMISFSEGVKAL
ncbi:hypothetical protein [Pseudogracilibacillus auburnensis]|uniref:hypothetical protein n=1 Tax=Pseudogracilibacillus auburnensis TaxID=1494959 RepID=UPI001A9680FA|nr:hypothetical protein [Pseudogracilibacillus auburnensis]MBO1002798.1 hypothetical protein [Pseudogracilibacillus auburnensis]